MEEIEIKTASGDFVLNNNADKYNRAKQEAGVNASPEELLAYYDKLEGLIKDKHGNVIKNGIFWSTYERWRAELPEFTRLLDQREKLLDEGEDRVHVANSLNVEHKRAFLGTLMTISAATIAGLFLFFTNSGENNVCFEWVAKISGVGHAIFILASSAWLASILSQESEAMTKRLKFIKDSRNDFVEKVGTEIINIESYERYRKNKNLEEKDLEQPLRWDSEYLFRGLCWIFVISSLPLLVIFWLA